MMSETSRMDFSRNRLVSSPHVAEDQEQRVPTTIRTAQGDFWYDGYKEPLTQLEAGVPGQPQGVQLKASGSDKLACAFCGKAYDNLGAHAAKTHGLKAPEYKREVGLLQKSALVSETTRMRITAVQLRRWRSGTNRLLEWGDQPAATAAAKVAISKYGHGKASAESRNMGGRCYAQVIAVAREVQRHGKITERKMRQHRINHSIIDTYFGSWDNFLRHMNEDTRRSGSTWRDDDLLTALKSLAQELGRSPSVSDMRRYGMPTRKTYETHFGTWRSACERVGIPWRSTGGVPKPETDDETVAVLSAYAILGNVFKVSRKLHSSIPRVQPILARYGIASLEDRFGHSAPQRIAQMKLAATIAARIAGWPEEEATA